MQSAQAALSGCVAETNMGAGVKGEIGSKTGIIKHAILRNEAKSSEGRFIMQCTMNQTVILKLK
jgi:hypothetical protein